MYEAAFWKSMKGCTNVQVKHEGNARQIRKGKVADSSCNCNFPTGIQFVENMLSELYLISCEREL